MRDDWIWASLFIAAGGVMLGLFVLPDSRTRTCREIDEVAQRSSERLRFTGRMDGSDQKLFRDVVTAYVAHMQRSPAWAAVAIENALSSRANVRSLNAELWFMSDREMTETGMRHGDWSLSPEQSTAILGFLKRRLPPFDPCAGAS